MDFLGVGLGEVLLVVVIALIVLGPERLVESASSLGRLAGELRRASQEFADQINQELEAPPPSKKPSSPNQKTPLR
ncbi:MAG: twin-arginine translocase TatA/TatE family subunit [Chloroflexi bacterium]|nr:twin-arginine translocase TatA/TatE family subunit [Chloroflexota bacterium]